MLAEVVSVVVLLLVAAALVEVGREIGCCGNWPASNVELPFPSSPVVRLPSFRASYLGVTSPLAELPTPAIVVELPLTMPRPGIIGVLRELVDALPFAPKGNLDSNAPERELEEVLGREDPPKEPQLLAWLWPFC